MRAGYVLMGLGVALMNMPLVPQTDTRLLYEAARLCLVVLGRASALL